MTFLLLMKEQIAILIVFIILISTILLVNIPYSEYISLVLVFILLIYQLLRTIKRIAKENAVEGEFVFRQQRKSIELFPIFFVLLMTIFYLSTKSINAFIVGSWWMIALFNIANSILISKTKPIPL